MGIAPSRPPQPDTNLEAGTLPLSQQPRTTATAATTEDNPASAADGTPDQRPPPSAFAQVGGTYFGPHFVVAGNANTNSGRRRGTQPAGWWEEMWGALNGREWNDTSQVDEVLGGTPAATAGAAQAEVYTLFDFLWWNQ